MITHEVLEFRTAGDGVRLLRGEATMAGKSEPDPVVRAPFMHIFYLDQEEPIRIRTLRITAGPLQTDAVMGPRSGASWRNVPRDAHGQPVGTSSADLPSMTWSSSV